jgi:hypothetical protein
VVLAREAGLGWVRKGVRKGGAGGNLRGIPGALGKGSPRVSPATPAIYAREPLELFPTSASGPLGVGVRSGTAEAATLLANRQAPAAAAPEGGLTVAARLVLGLGVRCVVAARRMPFGMHNRDQGPQLIGR